MNNLKKEEIISKGKAKTLYSTNNPDFLIMEFRDDISAGDGIKTATLDEKGMINNKINAHIMTMLDKSGIETHHVATIGENESLVNKLNMLPVECVARNILAGSICRRLGVPEGERHDPPVFEFFLKDDGLHDPLINDSHILAFKWATLRQIELMKLKTLAVNRILREEFLKAKLLLVDFKLEFGVDESGEDIVLGDEFSPDGCRLWDSETFEIYDKDRFRKDKGDVVEFYKDVADRLGIVF